MSEGAFFSLRPNGVELRLRVAPRASREGIEGIREDAQGAPVLRVAVNAPPEGGKANAAVAKLLAKTFRVAKSCVSVKSGAAARDKTIFIEGEPADLADRLTRWKEEFHP